MNIKQLTESFPVLTELGLTPLIVGHHGVGKSEAIRTYAQNNGHYLFDLRLGQMSDAGDLLGLADFIKNSKGQSIATKFVAPDWMQETIQFAEKNPDKYAILFLDEVNRAPKDISQVLFQLLLDKKYHGVALPKNVVTIAAMNPSTENYNTYDFADEAYHDRFLQIKLVPSLDEWIQYAKAKFPKSMYPEFIRENPTFLKADMVDFELNVKPSPRSSFFAMRLEDAINKVNKNLDENVALELLMGLVGSEAASAYFGYKKEKDVHISGADILEHYPKNREKLLKHFQFDSARGDIVSAVTDRVVEELSKLERMTETQHNNLEAFIIDLSDDFTVFVIQKLRTIKAIENSDRDLNRKEDDRPGLFSDNSPLYDKIVKIHAKVNKTEKKEE